jgi:hypothetical protein
MWIAQPIPMPKSVGFHPSTLPQSIDGQHDDSGHDDQTEQLAA